MAKKRAMGRPKSTWRAQKDPLVLDARRLNVTGELLEEIRDAAHDYANPVIRLSTADAILHLEEELREARTKACQELHRKGWGWTRIGTLLGVSRQRAWQIGNR